MGRLSSRHVDRRTRYDAWQITRNHNSHRSTEMHIDFCNLMSPNIQRSPSPLEAMLHMGFGEVLLDDDIALDMGFGAPRVSHSVAVSEVAVDADVPMAFASSACTCDTVAFSIPSLTTMITAGLGTRSTPVTSSDAQLNASAEELASSPQPDLPSVFDSVFGTSGAACHDMQRLRWLIDMHRRISTQLNDVINTVQTLGHDQEVDHSD